MIKLIPDCTVVDGKLFATGTIETILTCNSDDIESEKHKDFKLSF